MDYITKNFLRSLTTGTSSQVISEKPIFEIDNQEFIIKIDNQEIKINIVKPLLNKDKILPVAVFFHGGGWVTGGYNDHALLISQIAVKANIALIAIDYPLAPEHKYPVAVNQSYVATKWIWENGEKIGIDSKKLAIIGSSAGGNIAAVVTQMAADSGNDFIKNQILLCPVTDLVTVTESFKQFGNGDYFPTAARTEYCRDSYIDYDHRAEVYASPIMADLKRMTKLPRTLIITAEYDIHRDEGENYAHKLMEAGVEIVAMRCLGAIHSQQYFKQLVNTPAAKFIIDNVVHELKLNLY